MKPAMIALGLVLATCVAADAQVINGESTYEDNYIHTPPNEAATGRTKTRVPAPAEPTTSRLAPAPDDSAGAPPY